MNGLEMAGVESNEIKATELEELTFLAMDPILRDILIGIAVGLLVQYLINHP